MWQIYQAYRQFRLALEAGDWRKAARLVVEILNLLVPEEGTEGAIREPVGADPGGFTDEAFKLDAKAVKAAIANPPKGSKPKGAGGAIIVALITTLGPLLLKWIENRRKEQAG